MSIDMDAGIWDGLAEGRRTSVRYLPDEPEKCILEVELGGGMCMRCTRGFETIILNVIFIGIPGFGAVGLLASASGGTCGVLYGLITVVLDGIILIVWAVNIRRFSRWIDNCCGGKDQVKEIAMGTPDASQGAVIGVPVMDASRGGNRTEVQ